MCTRTHGLQEGLSTCCESLCACPTVVAARHAPLLLQLGSVDEPQLVYSTISAFVLGDQIDARYQQQMEEIIELTGSPETAYSTFLYVVENLFNWDGSGTGKIISGSPPRCWRGVAGVSYSRR